MHASGTKYQTFKKKSLTFYMQASIINIVNDAK